MRKPQSAPASSSARSCSRWRRSRRNETGEMSRRPFRDFSIRAKLLWIVMLTSSIALIAAGIAIVAYDSITFTQQKQNDLATQAAILAATSSAALEFNDTKAAKEYLAALKARPEVASAVMYDDKGKIFASYH